MTYVLIWIVISNGNPATGTAEFNSNQACQKMATALEQSRGRVTAICIEKGDRQ